MASDLHCFLTDGEQPKKTRDLRPGDLIWVDVNELSTVKDFFRSKSF